MPADPVPALLHAVRQGLANLADPAAAPGMQAYMKSTMPYLGVPTPPRSKLLRTIFAAHPLASRAAWEAAVRGLWHEANYREERYAAVALTGAKQYSAYQQVNALPLYQQLITEGAWWDYVDELATRRVGPILYANRTEVTPIMRAWSIRPDPWLRRTAILSQLTFKAETDLELLTDVIEANRADKGFFIRKAIGWALRQYARTDPEWVRTYVAANESELSGLSKREALKHLNAVVPS
jgi:3-methyladenine DNA glycosylase AlkD